MYGTMQASVWMNGKVPCAEGQKIQNFAPLSVAVAGARGEQGT